MGHWHFFVSSLQLPWKLDDRLIEPPRTFHTHVISCWHLEGKWKEASIDSSRHPVKDYCWERRTIYLRNLNIYPPSHHECGKWDEKKEKDAWQPSFNLMQLCLVDAQRKFSDACFTRAAHVSLSDFGLIWACFLVVAAVLEGQPPSSSSSRPLSLVNALLLPWVSHKIVVHRNKGAIALVRKLSHQSTMEWKDRAVEEMSKKVSFYSSSVVFIVGNREPSPLLALANKITLS